MAHDATWLPEGIETIGARIRQGERALDIRNSIMETEGLSKLAAGKKVEAVEKILRAAKAALWGGIASAVAIIALLIGTGEFSRAQLLLGVAAFGQLTFAYSVFSQCNPPSDGAG